MTDIQMYNVSRDYHDFLYELNGPNKGVNIIVRVIQQTNSTFQIVAFYIIIT